MRRAPNAKIYKADDGSWRWRLAGGNGEILASGEGHSTKRDAKRAMMTALIAASELVGDDPEREGT